MVISIEKEITEMNLDIERVIRLFFSLKYDLLYRLGLDGTFLHCELVPKCTLSIYTEGKSLAIIYNGVSHRRPLKH